ncbi:MAG: hypothetical protein ACREUV_01785 [Burkholderiales bacterium]
MDSKTVYSKTGKGVLEVKNKSLPKDLSRILSLVDGKSNVGNILDKESKLPEAKVKELLQKLETDGYTKIFSTGPQTMFSGDLDFSGMVVSEVKPEAFNEAKARQQPSTQPPAGKAEAEARAKAEAEARARKEAEEKARREAEAKARAEAEARAKTETEAKARKEAEEKARKEAEEKARRETEEKTKRDAEAEARAEQEEEARRKAEAEMKVRIEAEAHAKIEAEMHAKAEAAVKASSQPGDDDFARLLAGIEEQEKAEAEARARDETEKKTEKEVHAKVEEDDWAKAEREIRASIQASARKEAEANLDFGPLTDTPPLSKTPPLSDFLEQEESEEEKLEEARRRESEAKEHAKAEEAARKEAEREVKEKAKAEEEARKQAEKEEKARAKAIAKARRKPFNWKPVIIGAVVLLAAAIGIVHVVPLNNYIPAAEKLISASLQEPVTIGKLRVALLPAPQVSLEGVIVGKLKDIKIETVRVAGLGLVTGGGGMLDDVEVESITLDQDALPRVAAWSKAKNGLQLARVKFKNVRLALRNIPLAPLNGEINLSQGGAVQNASIKTLDGKISAQISAKRGQFEVAINAKEWRLPLGPDLAFDYLDAKGTATQDSLQLTDIDSALFGGKAAGTASLKWSDAWDLSGNFEAKGLEVGSVLNVFARNFSMSGRLGTRVSFAMQSPAPEKIFQSPRVEGTFTVSRGSLNNVDLIRALQTPNRDGIRGGKTLFDEFAGKLKFSDGRYKFSEMKLVSGPLTALGYADIAPDKQITGHASVELKSKATFLKNSFNVSGNLNDLVLRPQ